MKPHSYEARFLNLVNLWVNEGPPWYGPDVMAFHHLKEFILAAIKVSEMDMEPVTRDAKEFFEAKRAMNHALEEYRAHAKGAMIARGKKGRK